MREGQDCSRVVTKVIEGQVCLKEVKVDANRILCWSKLIQPWSALPLHSSVFGLIEVGVLAALLIVV